MSKYRLLLFLLAAFLTLLPTTQAADVSGRVVMKLKEGLLVDIEPTVDRVSLVLLVGYPASEKPVDFVMTDSKLIGKFTYTDTTGVKRTVPKYKLTSNLTNWGF